MRPPASMLEFDAMGGEDWDYISRGDESLIEQEDHRRIIETHLNCEECPYCGTPLAVFKHMEEISHSNKCLWELGVCKRCMHWRFTSKYLNTDRRIAGIDWDIWVAKARCFDVSLPTGPTCELVQEIRRNTSRWSDINPTRLEHAIADIFRANFMPCEVLHVGRPGDKGIDVVYIDSGHNSWLVQVKRRVRKGGESVTTIRNMLGVLVVQGMRQGIVVSTADHFTHHAYEEAMQADAQGYRLQLIDRGRLDRLLDPLLPSTPWLFALSENLEEKRDHDVLKQLSSQVEDLFAPRGT